MIQCVNMCGEVFSKDQHTEAVVQGGTNGPH